MVGVEKQDSLRFIKRLVSVDYVQMDLWQNGRGDLFISLPTADEAGEVFVATTEDILLDFFDNRFPLGKLAAKSPSRFCLLIGRDAEAALYLPDAELAIKGGHLRYSQIKKMGTVLTVNHSTDRPHRRLPVHLKKFYWVWSKG